MLWYERQEFRMDLGLLRTMQLSDTGWTWYQEYLGALDAYDLARYSEYLSDDVSIRFNNDPPMQGKDSVTQGLATFWGAVTGLGYTLLHEPVNIYGSDEAFVLEALNHYDRPGQPRITIHAAAFTDRGPDGSVQSVRLYQDVSPLFAADEQS